MTPIRLGFVGLSTEGWASRSLAPPLFNTLLSSKYAIVALCTRSEASATTTAAKFSELAGREIRAYYGEHGVRDLVHDSEVDMVVVSVKIPDHLEIALQAIEAGKDLFVEWTPGRGYEETVKIQEAAKAKGVKVIVGAQAIQSAAIKKAKELVDAGKIGRVLSTTAIITGSGDINAWGSPISASLVYFQDIDAESNALTILIGHFLAALEHVLGPFKEVTANGAIRFPTGQIIDSEGKPTGKVNNATAHDNVSVTGTLQDGTFVVIHCRAGLSCAGNRGKGRRMFQWIIDGEDGTIELTNKAEDGMFGVFFTACEKDLHLNGEAVELQMTDIDELGQAGKAWYEFANDDGSQSYTTIDDAVRLHRVVDAAKTSILEGRRITLQ